MMDIQSRDVQCRSTDLRLYLPVERLRPLVKSYHFLEANAPLSDLIYPGPANIRFVIAGSWRVDCARGAQQVELPKASLWGPSDRGRRFATDGGLVMGVELTPAGWLTLIGGDASALANVIVPLGERLGLPASDIRQRLAAAPRDAGRVAVLEEIFDGRSIARSSYCKIAAEVEDAIQSGAVNHVSDLAGLIGIDHRRLLRVCTSAFGFPPVRLLRRQRFLRTLTRLRARGGQPLGQLIDAGYYDQAHFNRDFKAYMGMPPLTYLQLPHEAMDRLLEEKPLPPPTLRGVMPVSTEWQRRAAI